MKTIKFPPSLRTVLWVISMLDTSGAVDENINIIGKQHKGELMGKYVISAESGSDLTPELAKQYGVEIVPMHVTMGTQTLDDGTFPPIQICEYYEANGALPKTSGSTIYDFEVVFDRIHEESPEAHILHLAYSGVTTVSYNCAILAAEDRDYVTIIDTKHVSAGQGFVVVKTAMLLQENPDISIEELVRYAEDLCERTKMCFLPADLEYLHAGGRCSNLAFLGGRLLHLQPLIEILEGKLIATKKYRGSTKKTIPKLIREFTEKKNLAKAELYFLCTVRLSDENKKLAEVTASEYGYNNVRWIHAQCVITTHGGPGCFGIVGLSE